MRIHDEVLYFDAQHPLVAVAYKRWKRMSTLDVLTEMALIFHLAVKIEDVKALDRAAKLTARNTKRKP